MSSCNIKSCCSSQKGNGNLENALKLSNGTDRSPSNNRTTKKTNKRQRFYDSTVLSVQPNMNETTNVLMQYTLSDLSRRAETNFVLALICVFVCGINVVLLILNGLRLHDDDNADDTDVDSKAFPDISERTFHLLEFWTSFVYSIAEASALVSSPKTITTITRKPYFLKLLLFFNVVNSLVPALLITLDVEYFERIAHELEYLNEFTLSFVSLIFLASLLRSSNNNDSTDSTDSNLQFDDDPNKNTPMDKASFIMGLLACAVAGTAFGVYNLCDEVSAHYLEFTFNIITSLITFWFCMDNRFVAQMEIRLVLYGQHQNCNFCQSKQSEFAVLQAQQRRSSDPWKYLYGATSTMTNESTDTTMDDNKSTGEYQPLSA